MDQRERQPGGPVSGRAPGRGKGAARRKPHGLSVQRAAETLTSGAVTPETVAALQHGVGNAAFNRALVAVQRAEAEEAEAASAQHSLVDDVLSNSGRPLDAPLRSEMEARLNANFSDVRLHTDAAAQRAVAGLGARAITSGSHVAVGAGGGDRHTLAHELTHVIQQRQGPVAGTDNGHGLSISDPSDAFERAAEENAYRVMSGPVPAAPADTGTPGTSGTSGVQVQRHAAPAGELGESCDHATHGGPVVQRAPRDWRGSNAVRNVSAISGSAEHWRPILDLVRLYGDHRTGDLRGRRDTLHRLGAAIRAWERNQNRRLIRVNSSSDKQQALRALQDLIADEGAEMEASPAQSPARGQSSSEMGRTAGMEIAGGRAYQPASADTYGSYGAGTSYASGARQPTSGGYDDDELAFGLDDFEPSAPARSPARTSYAGYGSSPSSSHGSRHSARPGGISPVPSLPDSPPRISRIQASTAGALPLPQGLSLRFHATSQENIESIHATGLRPAGGSGIGRPEDSDPDAFSIYVLSGSAPVTSSSVLTDAGRNSQYPVRGVGVMGGPDVRYAEDSNYERERGHRGAYTHSGNAVPARNYAGRGAVSFVLPLGQGTRTMASVTEMINQYRVQSGEPPVREAQARTMIYAALQRQFGASMAIAEHLR
jgi:phosphotransferase system HPr-like phosphotransfer protein